MLTGVSPGWESCRRDSGESKVLSSTNLLKMHLLLTNIVEIVHITI